MDGGSTESGGTGGFCISWMTGLPAPDMILEFTSCKCRHVCQLPSCECMASRLKCTDECSLRECSYMKEDDPLVELEEQDESDEDDSDENDDE